jgi:hypothetical protein
MFRSAERILNKFLFITAPVFTGCILLFSHTSQAACGATTLTWDAGAGSTRWDLANNWNPNTIPNTATQNAVVVAASRNPNLNQNYTISCLLIQSGQMTMTNNRTLTLVGDYFRNLTVGNLSLTGTGSVISMAGTGPQTFENFDNVRRLTIANNTSVTLTQPFNILTALLFTGTTSVLYVDADLGVSGAAVTIPAGVTVHVRNGAILTSNVSLTVNGTLILDTGTSLLMGNGTTLGVSSSGTIRLLGTNGNVTRVSAVNSSSTYTFNMAGIFTGTYFKIERMGAAGLNITGTVQAMENGEFHYVPNNGHAITLGAAAVIPATLDYLGFFNDFGHANARNINATSFNLSSVSLTNWNGSSGGVAKETDPNNAPTGRLNWGSQAGTRLNISNDTPSGAPPATIAVSSADTHFATFAFSLNQVSTATNITVLKLTQTGTATADQIASVKIYKDVGTQNCTYQAGTDTQVDTTKTLLGNPAAVTFTVNAGDLQTDSDTDRACIHVLAATSATALNGSTIRFGVVNTVDVTNSQNYSFSPSSGPPVEAGQTTVVNASNSAWDGQSSTNWNTATNWSPNTLPSATRDCEVGTGARIPIVNVAQADCRNAIFQTGGITNYNSSTNQIAVYGALHIQTSHTFQNATNGVLAMRGAINQTINAATTFPGHLQIINTGTAGNNIVSAAESATIAGNLIVTSGKFQINDGVIFTVGGTVTVASGATLAIAPGGTLRLANGRTLTVNSGGTLEVVGTASKTATITSDLVTSSYNIIVNGTISARYYNFDHLGTATGLSVASTATINATNYFQDGSFTYPMTNSMSLLRLNRQIPGNGLSNISFASNGASATGVKNINTQTAAAGTLTITNYSGDWAGAANHVVNGSAPIYAINWSSPVTTIDLAREATGPSTVNAGSVYTMGRFSFKLAQAGTFNDTDITSVKIRLTGTGTSSDIASARLYSDAACSGSGGTLLSSGTFSGSPASLTLTATTGQLTVFDHPTTPAKTCIYIVYVMSPSATNAKTVGGEISVQTDVTNSQAYSISNSTSFPLNMGTPATINGSTITSWTGTTSTDWFVSTNWSAGLPTNTKNCDISNQTNDPIINGNLGTATCKNVNITNGILTFTNATNARLVAVGNFANTGTINWNDGVVEMNDGGTAAAQTVSSTPTINNLRILKTAGGTVIPAFASVTVQNLTYGAGNTGDLQINNGKTLNLTASTTITAGTLTVGSGGTLSMANGTTLTVNGGNFRTTGTHDVYPQNLSLKGKVTSPGTWGFNGLAGTVSLVGFVLDKLDVNGFRVSGTTTLSNFRGGHFTGLSTSYSTMRVMQLNSPNIPTTPADVEWYWAPNPPPAYAATYLLAHSTGCGGNTITFDRWTGDFADEDAQTPALTTKINQTNCNIVISYANSPVTLTGFTATPYNGAVLLDWSTGNEWQHRGFNVYRSQLNGEGFVQINSDLIRNMNGSLGPHGVYRFVDESAVNGVIYSYLIEDVPISGPSTRHGPVVAMPLAAYGTVPPVTGSPNQGGSDPGSDTGNGATPGPIDNDGVIDLGNGVHILAQTRNSMRVEIIPPTAVYSVSPWNATYKSVNIPGYSKSLVAGLPELAERSFLIEVNEGFTSAEVTQTQVTEAAPAAHKIQPAPEYTPDSNQVLVPSYNPDATAYANNSYAPTSYANVEGTLTEVNGKKYVRINVNPLKYNAVAEQIKAATKIILDIGLDGQAWRSDPPSNPATYAPGTVDGDLRIRYSQTGMYEITYDELANMGLEVSLSGAAISDLRGYFLGEEIALDINSSDGTFNSGDSIRFWGDTIRKLESRNTEVVISRYDLLSNGAAKRFANLEGNPTAYGSPDPNEHAVTDAKIALEEDHKFYNDRRLGDLEDHFFWARLGENTTNNLPHYNPTKDFTVNLPQLIALPNAKVRVIVYVRGRHQIVQESDHHVGVWINTSPFRVAEQVFSGLYKERIVFELPAYYFVPGNNTVRLEVLTDLISAGDSAYLDIDRIEVEYQSQRVATSDMHVFYKTPFQTALKISGFSSANVSVYEISDQAHPSKLINADISTPDLGASYDVLFAIEDQGTDSFGYRMVAVEDNGVLKPESMSIAVGADVPLKLTSNQADMIMIGFSDLLRAAEDLTEHRHNQGLNVKAIDVEQIYSEFSNGIASAQGIKDFLHYTYDNWQSPKPKYVLFVGDATFDLKDNQNNGHQGRMLPIAMLSGQFFDYASDAWFVNFDASMEPEMAVGRIPARNTIELTGYIEKLLAYENGERSPANEKAKTVEIFADADTYWEGFSKKATELSSLVTESNKEFSVGQKTRNAADNASVMKAEIIGKINNEAPLVVSLLGHGTEEMWSEEVFTNEDAAAMSNEKLPIVLGLACATGNYYGADLVGDGNGGADPDVRFLGEALVMNPNGGAVAYWGSPAYTVPDAQVALARGFLEEVSKETATAYHTVRIGDLMLKSKAAVSGINSSLDTVNSFTLLGDPAMTLPSQSFSDAVPTAADDKGGGCGGGSGGSGGCGTIGSPPNTGPGGPMATLLLMLMPLLVLFILGRRRQLSF